MGMRRVDDRRLEDQQNRIKTSKLSHAQKRSRLSRVTNQRRTTRSAASRDQSGDLHQMEKKYAWLLLVEMKWLKQLEEENGRLK